MPVCTMVRPCTLLPRGEEIWTAATRCWVAGLTWPVAVCSCRSTSAPAGNGVSVLRLCDLRYRRGWTFIFSCPVQKSRARGGDVDGLRGVVGVRGERGPSPVDIDRMSTGAAGRMRSDISFEGIWLALLMWWTAWSRVSSSVLASLVVSPVPRLSASQPASRLAFCCGTTRRRRSAE